METTVTCTRRLDEFAKNVPEEQRLQLEKVVANQRCTRALRTTKSTTKGEHQGREKSKPLKSAIPSVQVSKIVRRMRSKNATRSLVVRKPTKPEVAWTRTERDTEEKAGAGKSSPTVDASCAHGSLRPLVGERATTITRADGRTALKLTHCDMTALPDLFLGLSSCSSPLRNLTRLSLANNRLTWIPAQIGWLVHLRELDVSNNRICELPCQIATKLTNIQHLHVGGNPLTYTNQPMTYLGHDGSYVPSLSELVIRFLINKDQRLPSLATKGSLGSTPYGELPEMLRRRLEEPWHPICAACDRLHVRPAATVLELAWICLVSRVPLRYDLCSASCAERLRREKSAEEDKRRRRAMRFCLSPNSVN